jgi:uncharacterized protein YbjT (DUF2867 family)
MKGTDLSGNDIPRSDGTPRRRILLAGATGYLGGFVLRELKKRRHFVRALTRSPERVRAAEPDEVARAEITRPETLATVCDGTECVFSSIGMTRQHDGLTWRDVDYRGNLNLLRVARAAGVSRFVYVSLFDGSRLRHLDIVAAHEDFVDELKASGLEWTVIRPTGYFSDLKEVYDMAGRGRVYLLGRGEHRVNPIHGEDLASVCADAVEASTAGREIDVGGPRIFAWRRIAEIALEARGMPRRIVSIPPWTLRPVVGLVRPFSRHRAELIRFFATMATRDFVAPATGAHDLEEFYRDLARADRTDSGGSR